MQSIIVTHFACFAKDSCVSNKAKQKKGRIQSPALVKDDGNLMVIQDTRHVSHYSK